MYLALLGYGIFQRSASFIAIAGVFSMLTGVMLVGEGVSYPTGYQILGADDNTMNINESYSVYTTYNSQPVNMWHYLLIYGGFVWIIVAIILAIKGRQGDILEE